MRGVWCRPDRPAGRGQKARPSAVKTAALRYGLPVYQPENFHDPQAREALKACAPDVLAVAAYGLILPQSVLDIPRLAPLNVHASLLPRYRGAAPVQRAIMDGCEQSGVSIMRMEAGLDTGPVYAVQAVDIGEHSSGSLLDELARLGGALLTETLAALLAGTAHAVPQNADEASYAPRLDKNDAYLRPQESARAVHARIRALTPRPGAKAVFTAADRTGNMREIPVILAPGKIGELRPPDIPPGLLWRRKNSELSIACADYLYDLTKLRPAGLAFMSAADFARGFLQPGPPGVCGEIL